MRSIINWPKKVFYKTLLFQFIDFSRKPDLGETNTKQIFRI
ncbi:hypothetical protein LEP1GSC059_4051 [Leptospira noguchii serovar Panama str. CZ214]|uniref:Uncharacterized protein n=1 Tax=Leptospira noguchii serovar Panama str. CZ214 TaxID=1001595 RepID=T0H2Z2_9LEPT|nr:hypothetical protein LEP1GSC059_4051 [Leptospira noguchii serovar Panama str. CZ214]